MVNRLPIDPKEQFLNFSGIIGILNNYRNGLDAHCGITFENFCKIYANLLSEGTLEGFRQMSGVVNQLDSLYRVCERGS